MQAVSHGILSTKKMLLLQTSMWRRHNLHTLLSTFSDRMAKQPNLHSFFSIQTKEQLASVDDDLCSDEESRVICSVSDTHVIHIFLLHLHLHPSLCCAVFSRIIANPRKTPCWNILWIFGKKARENLSFSGVNLTSKRS